MRPSCPVAVLLTLFLLTGCSQQPKTASDRLQVAASFYPLAYFAGRIGGEYADVLSVTPPGIEPHDFEPTPAILSRLKQAKVLLANGEGVDAWVTRIAPDLRATGVDIVWMSENMNTLLPASPDDAAAHDPHIWLDPVHALTFVERIESALAAADPVHAQDYRANALTLKIDLRELDEEYRTGLSDCALHEIVTSHAAFGYIADRYGFTQLAIAGMSPEDEPSPRRIAELADLAKSKSIGVIFFETLASPKLSETIASEIGATTAVLNSLEGLTDDDREQGKDYLSIMRENLRQLRTALRCP